MMNRRLLSLLLVLSLLMSLTAALALTPGTYEGEAKGMCDGVKVAVTLDEKGNLGLVNGQTAEDYLKSRADIFGLHLASKGAPITENGEAYKKAIDTGDMMAALRNAPKKSK